MTEIDGARREGGGGGGNLAAVNGRELTNY